MDDKIIICKQKKSNLFIHKIKIWSLELRTSTLYSTLKHKMKKEELQSFFNVLGNRRLGGADGYQCRKLYGVYLTTTEERKLTSQMQEWNYSRNTYINSKGTYWPENPEKNSGVTDSFIRKGLSDTYRCV